MKMHNYLIEGTLTAVEPLATCSKDLGDSVGNDKPKPVPSITHGDGTRTLYFPASGLAGTLRRRANTVVHRLMVEVTGNQKPFGIDDLYQNVLGGIKGKGAEDKSSVLHEQIVRERNPLLSLFGAGDAGFIGFMQSKLHIGNAVAQPNIRAITISGARTDLFYRDPVMRGWLSDDDLQGLVTSAIENSQDSKIKAELKKIGSAIIKAKDDPEKLVELRQAEADLKAAMNDDNKNSIGRPLAGYQAIPPSTTLTHNNRLYQATDIELGCLVAALNEWSLDPLIGAHKARGCGTVSGVYDIKRVTHDGLVSLGTVTLTPHQPATIVGDELHSALAAFHAFMKSDKPFFGIPTKENTEANA